MGLYGSMWAWVSQGVSATMNREVGRRSAGARRRRLADAHRLTVGRCFRNLVVYSLLAPSRPRVSTFGPMSANRPTETRRSEASLSACAFTATQTRNA
eukprot:1278170-Rhodomonas_salina.3